MTHEGYTSLVIASHAGHFEIVKYLIEIAADIDGTESEDSPLYIASQGGHFEIVKCLIDIGADKDKATNSGHTPLAVASQGGQFEIIGCISMLLACNVTQRGSGKEILIVTHMLIANVVRRKRGNSRKERHWIHYKTS